MHGWSIIANLLWSCIFKAEEFDWLIDWLIDLITGIDSYAADNIPGVWIPAPLNKKYNTLIQITNEDDLRQYDTEV